jgi:intein/homing endonuclease
VPNHIQCEEDIFFDRVVFIEEVANTGPWVYDLSM